MNAIETIDTPCLVIDTARMERNIADMAAKLGASGVTQRPHFKTSKMLEVAKRQASAGAVGFTCATPGEVEALLEAGFDDIFWAHAPATPAKAARAAEFNARGRVAVGIDSLALAQMIERAAQRARVTVPVLLEIDTGLRRTGVSQEDALSLAEGVSRMPRLRLDGLYMHEGQLASMQGPREVLRRGGRNASQKLVSIANDLRAAGHEIKTISVGSTPGWDSAPFEDGVTEARAGTYVFHDANQWRLGSAGLESLALTVHSTIVSVVRPGEVVIDAGIKAMSSDGSNRDRSFGIVVDGGGRPIPGVTFARAYEEHGVLEGDPSLMRWQVGDRVRIVPNHACGAVNMWSRAIALNSDASIEEWHTVGRH